MDHVSAPSNRGGAHQPGPKTATPHVSWSTSLHPNSNDIPSATKRVGIHPAIFQCTLCPKRFTRAYNLRSHLRTHTDERPFVCTVCGKAFARQHDRKRHEGLHSGEKKFVCKGELRNGGQWGCGRRFARADALERHFGSETGRICIKPAVQEGSFKGVVDGSSSPRGPERPELRARTELTAVSYTISRDGTDERKVHAERLCALDGGYRARHCKKKSEREERGDLDRHQLPRLKPRGLERMESPFLLQSFGQSGISGTTNSEKVTLDQSAGVGRTVRSYAPVGGSGLGPWPTSSDLSERFEPIDEHYPRPDKINTTATSPRATRSRYSSPPPVPFEVEKSRPGPENLNRLPSRSSFYSPQRLDVGSFHCCSCFLLTDGFDLVQP